MLSVGAIVGFTIAAVLAARAAPKVKEELDSLELPEEQKARVVEKVKTAIPHYATPVGIGLISAGMVLGANQISSKRLGAVTTAYILTKDQLLRFKDQTKIAVGDKKFEHISSAARVPEGELEPPNDILRKNGTIVYDTFSDRWFDVPDLETVKQLINELNAKLFLGEEAQIDLNDFYWELGLNQIKYGNNLGWTPDSGGIKVYFDAKLHKDRPIVTMSFEIEPKHYYHELLRG